ncbi:MULTISPECIES: helix-turn-helix transcriptional regulator [unclassified Brevibacterium]|uniref:helix-turn-helix transcriptional regulator n=1 Tax=unclassified Brevibacterium TaxID=2614124 RepID=UPI0010815E99|nr:helix-turn-helix domain-containing protein [Brevibacterium sp. S111]TGD08806.1 ArsR family transcriptional regulator [Brevibacterium sp. S111]
MDTRLGPRGDSLGRPDSTAARGGRRAEILRQLRGRSSATAVELAESLGVHPNTVRFHLGVLERDGDVVRHTRPAHGPGRPEVRYFLTPATDSGPHRADLLARILLSRVASAPDPAGEAEEAGYQWGSGAAAGAGSRADSAVDGLIDTLDAAGFAPARLDGNQIDLHNCPLREFLGTHGSLVCAIHRGMMTGFLEAAQSSNAVESLEPFATPTSCRARLRRR